MIQGKLKQFEKDFLQIKEKAQLNKISPNAQKRAEDPSTSSHQSTAEQSRDGSEEISLLHSIISDMKEKFREMELELELVQLREEMHRVGKETDPTEKEADYRKEIEMLKKEIQEMKKQGEEYSNQLSVVREEMRKLREDRESHIQLSAVEKQPTQRGEQQSSEEPPPPVTTETRPSSPPPADSYSPSQPHIILLMDSNGKFIDEKRLFPRKKRPKNLVPKHTEGPGALV
ncbi:proline-, glutamic acid- and leucine-rich protein 1-like [Xyrauchen texanus]|uniref:proline-, glutamic acid- and leucine-rich protein 1-like n=1 Tax=Xyrauchen texanus TaxID=154827 RepID=UPI0022418F9A|nr:proline-, glutamic acid- and leucine-rich protein 1-like [Xyrauchen texanus]